MNAPLIFILLPAVFTPVLFVFQRYPRFNQVLGTSAMLVLLLLSWRLPVNSPIFLGIPGIPALVVSDSLFFLGRRFFIDDSLLPVLTLIYLALNFWFIASFITHIRPLFIPLCFGIGVLLVASIAVDPPLYSALIIVLAALFSIPLFSPPGKQISNSALRLLIFEVLGMGLFLFADWYLSSIQSDQQSFARLPVAFALLGLGLAFMAGVFPFHTWLPMIAGSSAPLAASFAIFFIPLAASITGLRYLLAFSVFQPIFDFQPALRLVGILMVVAGGTWAVMERHLGRVMAFAMLVQVGSWLLAFTIIDQSVLGVPLTGLFYSMLIPQSLALVTWAISLDIYYQAESDDSPENLQFISAQGLAHRYPLLASGLLVANFALAGLPLLANFPYLFVLSAEIAKSSLLFASLYWIGHTGLLIAGLRTLAAVTAGSQDSAWQVSESRHQVIWLLLFMLAIVLLGILPQWQSFDQPTSSILTGLLIP